MSGWLKRQVLLPLLVLAFAAGGCTSKDEEETGSVSCRFISVDRAGESGSGGSSKIQVKNLQESGYYCTEYYGMALQMYDEDTPGGLKQSSHVGSAVVDGIKIKLETVYFYPVDPGGITGIAFDWGGSPREFEFTNEFSVPVTETSTVLAETYGFLCIMPRDEYSLKAWAYLDADEDGIADKTIWTTPGGIQSVDQKYNSTAQMTDYGYYQYPFSTISNVGTPFQPALVVQESGSYQVEICLDTFKTVQVWDGTGSERPPWAYWGSNTPNTGPNTDWFPDGETNFCCVGMNLFGFVNQGVTCESYFMSVSDPPGYNDSNLMTVIYDDQGVPILARIRSTGGYQYPEQSFCVGCTTNIFQETSPGIYKIGIPHGFIENLATAEVTDWINGFKKMEVGDAPIPLTMEYSVPDSGYLKRIRRRSIELSDDTAPGAISDLAASTGTAPDTVDLSWTAPGDDGSTGRVIRYVIVSSDSPITDASFDDATAFVQFMAPQESGNAESITVTGLPGGQNTYFAVKGIDDSFNAGPISNVASASAGADATPPAAISDVSNRLPMVPASLGSIYLFWTAPGDNGTEGRASGYIVKYAQGCGTIDDTNFDSATTFSQSWVPKRPGMTEYREITGLTPGVSYSIAIKAVDEVPNTGSISNVGCFFSCDDVTPPAAVDDLAAVPGSQTGTVDLTWTNPGDDGDTGTANRAQVRYGDQPITDENRGHWGPEVFPVGAAGTTEHATVTNLTPGSTYYFMVTVKDDWYNESPISNVVTAVAKE